jgi:hypothetical protein
MFLLAAVNASGYIHCERCGSDLDVLLNGFKPDPFTRVRPAPDAAAWHLAGYCRGSIRIDAEVLRASSGNPEALLKL